MGSMRQKYVDINLKLKEWTAQDLEKFNPYFLASSLTQNLVHIACLNVRDAVGMRQEIDCGLMVQRMPEILFRYGPSGFLEKYDDLPGYVKFLYDSEIVGGNQYNLNCKSSEKIKTFEFDTIKISVGVSYKGFNSIYVRTLLINPTENIKNNYNFLMSIVKVIINNLRDGVELSRVYKFAMSFANAENQHLAEHLKKEFGFALNRFSPDDLVIKPNTRSIARYGMNFCINVDLIGLKEGERVYDLCSSHTVIVKESYTQARALTYHQQHDFDAVVTSEDSISIYGRK